MAPGWPSLVFYPNLGDGLSWARRGQSSIAENSVNGIFTLTVKGIILLLLAFLAFTKTSVN